jgi:hypothetical protein
MATISERILLKCTFLDEFDPKTTVKIDTAKEDAFVYYKSVLGKTDLDYKDEVNYTAEEKSLIVAYCTWYLAKSHVSTQSSTTWTSENTPTMLKRKKVDVLEKEWAVSSLVEGQSLNASNWIESLKNEICLWESRLGITNGVCQNNKTDTVFVPAVYFPTC